MSSPPRVTCPWPDTPLTYHISFLLLPNFNSLTALSGRRQNWGMTKRMSQHIFQETGILVPIGSSELECWNGREGRKGNRRAHLLSLLYMSWQQEFLMFQSRKLINNFIFSNNHQCNYTKTISCLRRREYRRIVTETSSR